MMIYLIASGFAVMLFYLMERLFLRRSTLFYAQRSYYIVAILSSLILPLIALISPDIRSRVAETGLDNTMVQISIEDVTATIVEDGSEEPSRIYTFVAQLLPILYILWCVGAAVMLIRYLYGHIFIARLLRSSKRTEVNGIVLYLTENEDSPFTYLRNIAIPRMMCDQPMYPMVLGHEMVHVRQRHYLDMILGSILQVLQWWNPFAWGITALQKNALEYIADREVLKEGIPHKEYQLYLLKSTIGRTADSLLLSFSMYNLKQRIFMMNKKKTTRPRVGIVYILIALPVLCCTVLSTQALNANKTVRNLMSVPAENKLVSGVGDVPPTFVGGDEAMYKFLAHNVKYPVMALENGIQGQVIVGCVVRADGTLSDVKILEGVDPALDKEAVRVVSAMPKFNPARDASGKAIEGGITIPLLFKLEGSGTNPDSQTTKTKETIAPVVVKAYPKEDTVSEFLGDMPEFIGGPQAMMKYISHNIKYPAEAYNNEVQGRVMVSFIVEKDGSISNIRILRGVDPQLDAEAKRVVASMPKWKPGTMDGKPVRARFNIPVTFRLEGDNTPAQPKKTIDKSEKDEDGVYMYLEEMPEFVGGQKAMMTYLADNIKYPEEAVKKNIQGRVMIRFIVKADGSLSEVKVLRGVDPVLDAEAVRVVSAMPKWKPGMKDGNPVAVQFTVPVNFKFNRPQAPDEAEEEKNLKK